MYCKNCGLSCGDEFKFCTSCGERLIDPELLALLPPDEQDTQDVLFMLTFDLSIFSLKLMGQAGFNSDPMEEEERNNTYDLIKAFLDGDNERRKELERIMYSDERVNEKTKKAYKRITEIFSFIRENIWMFEAANYILKKAGQEGIDMTKLRPTGINLSGMNEQEDNADKIFFLDDNDMVLDDYLFELSDFADEVQGRLEELEDDS